MVESIANKSIEVKLPHRTGAFVPIDLRHSDEPSVRIHQGQRYIGSSYHNSSIAFDTLAVPQPHAVTDGVKALVTETFASTGITVLSEGSIAAETIDEKKLIDQHYYAIASKATILKPSELNVPVEKFEVSGLRECRCPRTPRNRELSGMPHLSLPASTPPRPQAQFGLTWEAALAAGNVYNAMDGCAVLGIDADTLDAEWGKCKKAKKLVKFVER